MEELSVAVAADLQWEVEWDQGPTKAQLLLSMFCFKVVRIIKGMQIILALEHLGIPLAYDCSSREWFGCNNVDSAAPRWDRFTDEKQLEDSWWVSEYICPYYIGSEGKS